MDVPYTTDWLQFEEEEGSGEMTLQEFKKKTATYLKQMAKHQRALEIKNELKEHLRDMKMDMVVVQNEIGRLSEDVQNNSDSLRKVGKENDENVFYCSFSNRLPNMFDN